MGSTFDPILHLNTVGVTSSVRETPPAFLLVVNSNPGDKGRNAVGRVSR